MIKKGSPEVARWREQEFWQRRQLDLSGAFLSRARLANADLAHDNLSGIDLTGADLRLADLSGANLQAAHLWRSNLAQIDLRDAVLTGATLGRSKLSGSFLQGANLRGADLSFADLSCANLAGASLAGADLSNTDLSWTNLAGADLRSARLTAASLELADLTEADLRGAWLLNVQLKGAFFDQVTLDMTLFGDCDLSQVIGLRSVRHAGPSIIGLDTLARSRGQVPDEFLRRAGVAEPLIAAQQQLQGTASIQPRVLVAGSVQDAPLLVRICEDLNTANVPTWSLAVDDEKTLRSDPGFSLRTYYYDRLALVCSSASLESPHVYRFFDGLLRGNTMKSQAIITVAVDDLVFNRNDSLCAALRKQPVADFRQWESNVKYCQGLAMLTATLATAAD